MVFRPESLGEQYAARFQDQSVVDRYHLRPTYPPETFAFLNGLIVDRPRVVLDVGCGPGNIARPLAAYVERVDAVDISLPMLERARMLSGDGSSRIRWQQGRAEDVELQPPYALVTAGQSLHWMDWGVVLPRFASVLTARGVLAIVGVEEQGAPWREGYTKIARRFSNNPTYKPVDLIGELEKYRLFQKLGEHTTAPEFLRQTIEDYIAAQHARSALSLETMTAEQATECDAEMYALLLPFAQEGMLTITIVGTIVWGKPLGREAKGEYL